MSTKFVTKRPHKKSRAGCLTCKTRKIKCDEAQPTCSFCSQRKLPCSYNIVSRPNPESPSSSSGSSSSQMVVRSKSLSPAQDDDSEWWDVSSWSDRSVTPEIMPVLSPLTTNDLRLMHHWSTLTWKTVGVGSPGMASVFEVTLPDLAFHNDFLMNGLLGVASLHMQTLLPDPSLARKQTDMYRAKAFSSFREALTKIDPQSKSYYAAVLMALVLVIICSKDYSDNGELTVVNWLILYRGLSSVMQLRSYPFVIGSSIGPVFRRELKDLETIPALPTILLNMMATMKPTDPDFEGFQTYCQALDTIAILYASLQEEGITPGLFVRLCSWPSHLNDQFVSFAKQRRPRAMIILAFYLSFLKLIKGVWWIEGISDPEIYAISKMLGSEWQIYLEVPLRVRDLSGVEEIASVLLTNMHSDLSSGDLIIPTGISSCEEQMLADLKI